MYDTYATEPGTKSKGSRTPLVLSTSLKWHFPDQLHLAWRILELEKDFNKVYIYIGTLAKQSLQPLIG